MTTPTPTTNTAFSGDNLTVTNIRDYKQAVEHTLSVEPELIQIWSDPTDLFDYDQLSVTVDEDEMLILEQNLTVGQGRYIAISEDVIESLLEDTILEN